VARGRWLRLSKLLLRLAGAAGRRGRPARAAARPCARPMQAASSPRLCTATSPAPSRFCARLAARRCARGGHTGTACARSLTGCAARRRAHEVGAAAAARLHARDVTPLPPVSALCEVFARASHLWQGLCTGLVVRSRTRFWRHPPNLAALLPPVWRWAPLLSAASSCCDAMFLLICLAAGAQLVACIGVLFGHLQRSLAVMREHQAV